MLAGAGDSGVGGAEVPEPGAADVPDADEAQAGGPAAGAPGVGAAGASAAEGVAQPRLVAALVDPTPGVPLLGDAGRAGPALGDAGLAGAALGLANPGLAKPAPVSSRARAAAASADVLSPASPPDSGFASFPRLGVRPGPAAPPGPAPPGPAAPPGFATLTGAGASPGTAAAAALAALSGPGTASALPLAADFFSAAAHTDSRGIVTSERGPSAGLTADGGLSASEDDEPFPEPAWTVFACTVFASAGTGLATGTAAAAESDFPVEGESCSDWSGAPDEPALAGLAGLLPASALALPDLRRFVSSSGAASPASSASSATGSACLSTRPPVKSLATTLSATSYAWAFIARSPQS